MEDWWRTREVHLRRKRGLQRASVGKRVMVDHLARTGATDMKCCYHEQDSLHPAALFARGLS